MSDDLNPLLSVRDLAVDFDLKRGFFGIGKRQLRAVDGVSFDIAERETLGLVGESGSGKSTVARGLLRLVEPTSGSVHFRGQNVVDLSQSKFRGLRKSLQIVFQDPYSSLNPSMTVGDIVAEPLRVHRELDGPQCRRLALEALEQVGLGSSHLERYPYEFSGGQRQRIAIARAIILEPDLIVLDEAVSALDVSTQSQVVNLLMDLQKRMGLTFLFIGHDLELVRFVSHRIAVMYLGRIVEIGPAKRLLDQPGHPYTAALASAVPFPHPRVQRSRARIVLPGEIPNPMDPPSGCRFRTRCPYVMDRCIEETPKMLPVTGGGTAACHLQEDTEALAGRSVLELAAEQAGA